MPKANGFVVFAKHKQYESAQKGNPIPSFQDAVNIFGKEWAVMSAAERKPFEDKAKWRSNQERSIESDSSSEHDSEFLEKTHQTPFFYVNSLLEESKPTNVIFVIMSCNYYCNVPTNRYLFVPAEIGMCAFSLKLGVIDNYWTLVDSQNIPSGKYLDAKESRDIHRIPLPPFEPRFQDLDRILLNISHFLQRYKPQSQDWTNVFCLPSEMASIEGCLNWLTQTVGSTEIELKFKLQQLPSLLFRLNQISLRDPLERVRRKWICKLMAPMGLDDVKKQNFANIGQCSEFLASTRRSFDEGLPCPFHEKVESDAMNRCSLGAVNRFAMNMLQVLAPRFRISSKHGFHLPFEDAAEQAKKRNEYLLRWGYLPEFLEYPDTCSDDESASDEKSHNDCGNLYRPMENDSEVKSVVSTFSKCDTPISLKTPEAATDAPPMVFQLRPAKTFDFGKIFGRI